MKAAIVYYSQSGNTSYVAEKVAAILAADLIPLVPVKAYPDSGFKKFFWGGKSALMGDKPALEPYAFDPESYDLVIFGAPTPNASGRSHGEERRGASSSAVTVASPASSGVSLTTSPRSP